MIANQVDVPIALTKISKFINLAVISEVPSYELSLSTDVYISIIAMRASCLVAVAENMAYSIAEGYSSLLSINRGELLRINSQGMASCILVVVIDRSFIDQLNPESEELGPMIKALKSTCIADRAIFPSALEILNENIPTHFKKLYQTSKILEVFSKQLFHIKQLRDDQTLKIKTADEEKVIRAKKLIDQHLEKTYTIAELARLIGTNEQYLKIHFKHIYGCTIYNYSLNMKMNFARGLLLAKQDKIADVATKIGYKHATHFSTAFKKFFGYLPNTLRCHFISLLTVESLIFI